ELKIPGFSNYLQSVGDGELIGLGQERVPGTWFSQLEVSLFDVTDGSAPKQIDRESISDDHASSWSEALYDHHALLFCAEDGLLVLPFTESGTDADGNWYYQQALAVMRVEPGTGIESVGEISTHDLAFRTVRIDNVLYAISENHVTAFNLDNLSE